MFGGPSKRSLLRMLERDRESYLAIIREQNDRIMQLAGKPWALPPRPDTLVPRVKPDDEHPEFAELVEL